MSVASEFCFIYMLTAMYMSRVLKAFSLVNCRPCFWDYGSKWFGVISVQPHIYFIMHAVRINEYSPLSLHQKTTKKVYSPSYIFFSIIYYLKQRGVCIMKFRVVWESSRMFRGW